jgi:hypothetical protein
MTDPTHDETETETDTQSATRDFPVPTEPDLVAQYSMGDVEVYQRGPDGLVLEVYDGGDLAGRTFMSHLPVLAEHMEDPASSLELRRALEQYDPDD